MSLDSQEGTGLLQDLGLSASVTARTCTGSRSRTPGAGGLRSPGRSALPCATGPLARWKGNPKASLLLSARAPSSSDTKEQRQAPRPPRGLSAGRSSVSLASPASPPGRRKTPSQPGELQIPGGRAPWDAHARSAKSAGGWSSRGPRSAPGTGRTPTCLRSARCGRVGAGRWTSSRERRRWGSGQRELLRTGGRRRGLRSSRTVSGGRGSAATSRYSRPCRPCRAATAT